MKDRATNAITHSHLREQTLEYWRLSRAKNGRGAQEALSVQDALQRLNGILGAVGPKRRVRDYAGLLMADIISPKRKRKPKAKDIIPPTQLRSTGA